MNKRTPRRQDVKTKRLFLLASWRLGVLLFLLSGGCVTQVIPPPHPSDPVTVYLTDYGRHASLLLPVEHGQYVEYAYGDWDFFAQGNTHWWIGLRAILHSPQATLGRRFVTKVNREALDGCDRLMQFQASRPRAEALAMNLDRRFRSAGEKPLPSTYSDLNHVRDPEQYWGLHNCNHETAEWLKHLGCEIRGTAIWSSFYIRE